MKNHRRGESRLFCKDGGKVIHKRGVKTFFLLVMYGFWKSNAIYSASRPFMFIFLSTLSIPEIVIISNQILVW